MAVWVECPVCAHKLFKRLGVSKLDCAAISVKCSSCKSIVDVHIFGEQDIQRCVVHNARNRAESDTKP